MSLLKSIEKRYDWIKNVEFDSVTGFYRYKRYGNWIYVRHQKHFLKEQELNWLCSSLFFKHYMPQNGDTVVDFGAGYGEEAVWLHSKSPLVNYYGIEIQPVIFECLSNTYNSLGRNFKAYPYAISDAPEFKLKSQFSYSSSSEQREGYIYIPTLKWDEFLKLAGIKSIDLLKMNIEGAEKYFLKSLKDMSYIKRFIISCHDFRANTGDGEHFRSKKEVLEVLKSQNYTIKTFSYNIGWSDDWIYAEKV